MSRSNCEIKKTSTYWHKNKKIEQLNHLWFLILSLIRMKKDPALQYHLRDLVQALEHDHVGLLSAAVHILAHSSKLNKRLVFRYYGCSWLMDWLNTEPGTKAATSLVSDRSYGDV
jgi:hypothetical protein